MEGEFGVAIKLGGRCISDIGYGVLEGGAAGVKSKFVALLLS